MGYGFFRDKILANGETLEPFISGLVTIIKNDRYSSHAISANDISDGEPVSAHLLLSSLSILSTLDLYYPAFAQALVESTDTYYHAEAENLSMKMTAPEYIAHVDSRLRQEERRCDRFFDRQSKKEVMQVVQTDLISRISEEIVARGFDGLVKSTDITSLRTLYHLLYLVKETEVLRTAWANHIKVQERLDRADGRIRGYNS